MNKSSIHKGMTRAVTEALDASNVRHVFSAVVMATLVIMVAMVCLGHLILMSNVWRLYEGDTQTQIFVGVTALLGLGGIYLAGYVVSYVSKKLPWSKT